MGGGEALVTPAQTRCSLKRSMLDNAIRIKTSCAGPLIKINMFIYQTCSVFRWIDSNKYFEIIDKYLIYKFEGTKHLGRIM